MKFFAIAAVSLFAESVLAQYAGGVLNGIGSYTGASGEFNLPIPTKDGTGKAVIGVDQFACDTYFQGAVEWTKSGLSTTYRAWYRWFPGDVIYTTDLSFQANDLVFVNVTSESSTTRRIYIKNMTRNKEFVNILSKTGEPTICGSDADWIVYDDAGIAGLTFTTAIATIQGGTSIHIGKHLRNLALYQSPPKIVASPDAANNAILVTYKQ